MDGAVLLVAIPLALAVLISQLKGLGRSGRNWPWCPECKRVLERLYFVDGYLPPEIDRYLAKHRLPRNIVSSYVCKAGHARAWYVPRVGDADKGVFIVHNR
jgi:hypothetical protein